MGVKLWASEHATTAETGLTCLTNAQGISKTEASLPSMHAPTFPSAVGEDTCGDFWEGWSFSYRLGNELAATYKDDLSGSRESFPALQTC